VQWEGVVDVIPPEASQLKLCGCYARPEAGQRRVWFVLSSIVDGGRLEPVRTGRDQASQPALLPRHCQPYKDVRINGAQYPWKVFCGDGRSLRYVASTRAPGLAELTARELKEEEAGAREIDSGEVNTLGIPASEPKHSYLLLVRIS
jgi:hypothetical protein